MKTLKVLAITFILLIVCMVGRTQTVKTVEDMAIKHQACLDSEIDMLGCSKSFYLQMDSMLNVVYHQLRATLGEKQKQALKNQQFKWIKKRDTYFNKQDNTLQKKYEKGEWGRDMEMITYDDKANFIKERVIVLIKRH